MTRTYKCKCKVCKKELTTDVAYMVETKGKREYYCSEQEYREKKKEEDSKAKCLETVTRLFKARMLPPIMVKKVNELRQFYDYTVIEKTFKECADTITWAIEFKDFNSEFTKAKYIISIVANNIDKVYKRHMKDLEDMERLFTKDIQTEIIDLDVTNRNTSNNISDISAFLD